MEERSAPATVEPRALIEEYLQAMKDRDLDRCVGMFADDATITFMNSQFKGRAAIETWHRDRFAAEGEIVKVDAIRVKGDTITLDALATSKKLRQWKIPKVGGRATFRLEDGKIKEFKMTPRLYNPLEGW